MLVILMENQMLAPQRVCQSCLLADRTGQPRWSGGELRAAIQLLNLRKICPIGTSVKWASLSLILNKKACIG